MVKCTHLYESQIYIISLDCTTFYEVFLTQAPCKKSEWSCFKVVLVFIHQKNGSTVLEGVQCKWEVSFIFCPKGYSMTQQGINQDTALSGDPSTWLPDLFVENGATFSKRFQSTYPQSFEDYGWLFSWTCSWLFDEYIVLTSTFFISGNNFVTSPSTPC